MKTPDIDTVVAAVRKRQNPTPLDKVEAAAFRARKRAEKKAAKARLKAWKAADRAGEQVRDAAHDLAEGVSDRWSDLSDEVSDRWSDLADGVSDRFSDVHLPDALSDHLPSRHDVRKELRKDVRQARAAVADRVPSVQDLTDHLPSAKQVRKDVADALPDAVTDRASALARRVPTVHLEGRTVVVAKRQTRGEKVLAAATPFLKAAPVVLVAAGVAFVVAKTAKAYAPGFLKDVKQGAAEREAELRSDLGLDVWKDDPNTPEDYAATGKTPPKEK